MFDQKEARDNFHKSGGVEPYKKVDLRFKSSSLSWERERLPFYTITSLPTISVHYACYLIRPKTAFEKNMTTKNLLVFLLSSPFSATTQLQKENS